MKRPWLIILGGLALAVCAYLCIYFGKTAAERSVERSDRPELAWLQMEFHLTDAQLARVMELHNAYAPKCDEMCRAIDAKNAEIQRLLSATNVITPEIKQALAQAAEIRAECETSMLDHFYKVAQTMPAEQGKRYLDWVQSQTLKPSKMMPGQSPAVPMNRP
ncbi:MAG: periplasmic heavy metal sensor [Verrucomicrobiota bacterium]